MSRRVFQTACTIAVIALSLSQTNPAVAQDDSISFAKIEKLERVAQIKRLEAKIAKSEAKKARALADIEVSKAKVEKAKAQTAQAKAARAWAQVQRLKANKEMQELTNGGSKVVKAEKK